MFSSHLLQTQPQGMCSRDGGLKVSIQIVLRWSAAPVAPGSLSEMQNLGPGIAPTESESVFLTSHSNHLYESFEIFFFLNFEGHQSTLDTIRVAKGRESI